MTSRNFLVLAAFFGALAVAAGAFGSHGLSGYFAANPEREGTYETAVQYQMYHALALVGAAWLVERSQGRFARWAGVLFTLGILLFSGSLYLLALLNLRFMGAVAPLGGAALILGWICLGLAAWRDQRS